MVFIDASDFEGLEFLFCIKIYFLLSLKKIAIFVEQLEGAYSADHSISFFGEELKFEDKPDYQFLRNTLKIHCMRSFAKWPT